MIKVGVRDSKLELDQYSRLERKSRELESQFVNQPSLRRLNGVYYTPQALAREFFERLSPIKKAGNVSFLEPCVGSGAFFFAFLDWRFKQTSGTKTDLQNIVNNMYAADIDEGAVRYVIRETKEFCKETYGHDIEVPLENFFVGDALIAEAGHSVWDPRRQFGVERGFDIIATNPPYFLLKATRDSDEQTKRKIAEISDFASNSSAFVLQRGVLNLYKLFVELIVRFWSAKDGTIGLLIPQSLMRDRQSELLREAIIQKLHVHEIIAIKENIKLFDGASQSFHWFWAVHGTNTSSIRFSDLVRCGSQLQIFASNDVFNVDYRNPTAPVMRVDIESAGFLANLEAIKTVRDYGFLVNKRGEVDVTVYRNFIDAKGAEIPLIRGNQVGQFHLSRTTQLVDHRNLRANAAIYRNSNRIACQQVSNANQTTRMKWAFVPKGFALANSCNFISVDPQASNLESVNIEVVLWGLLGILNSPTLERWFQLISSNNHISNSEIAQMPVGVLGSKSFIQISKYIENAYSHEKPIDLVKLDRLVKIHFWS